MSNLLMNRYYHAVLFSLLLLFTVADAKAQSLPDFTGIVEQNSPAVVNISIEHKKPVKRKLRHEFRIPGFPGNSPFEDFFRRHEERERGRDEGRGLNPESLGSGFIITSDGYVITNNHVVEDADKVIVSLSDRREFQAEVVGRDRQSDTAILKINAQNLPTVKIGKSSDLKVGEWVLAIGSPFGFDHTVTAGIVSAKGRSLPSENYVPFIQTDVAINPGNSGGPLFNLKGEVIGVNSQIYSRTGGFMGLSFAIPIDVAMNVADQLRATGKVSRGWLGVLIQDITKDLADSFGMKQPSGALVSKVLPDSPAEKAELKPGDVILEFNGIRLKNSSQLPPLVGSSPVNKSSNVTILRRGKRLVLDVTIGELPSDDEMKGLGRTPRIEKASQKLLGIKVKQLSEEQMERMQLKGGGIIVTEAGVGAGRSAGIRRGDVIQMINNQKVTSLNEFKQVVAKLEPGTTVAVLVLKHTGPIFLAMKVPEN